MLTCIASSKQLPTAAADDTFAAAAATPSSARQPLKSLTSQIKDMAVKATGVCRPCTGSSKRHSRFADTESAISGSEGFHYVYKRAGDSTEGSTPTPGVQSGDRTPSSEEVEEVVEDGNGKEWVAQVEPGVLITFVSVPEGGNDLKRIRFSREMFNKLQAQRWWSENYDKVMELYNVQRCNHEVVHLPTPPKSEDESSKIESAEDSPVTPPLSKERLLRNIQRPVTGTGIDPHPTAQPNNRHSGQNGRRYYDSGCLAPTPKLSSISGAKTSSVDAASMRTSSEADRSEEMSNSAVSNSSDQETEWVEQDEPGVYITIRALPGGVRELRRVRFSRERFGEMHARSWWEENRARIHEQYL